MGMWCIYSNSVHKFHYGVREYLIIYVLTKPQEWKQCIQTPKHLQVNQISCERKLTPPFHPPIKQVHPLPNSTSSKTNTNPNLLLRYTVKYMPALDNC